MGERLYACGVVGGVTQALEAERGGMRVRFLAAFWAGRAEVRELEAPGPIKAIGPGPVLILEDDRVLSYGVELRAFVSIGSLSATPTFDPPTPAPIVPPAIPRAARKGREGWLRVRCLTRVGRSQYGLEDAKKGQVTELPPNSHTNMLIESGMVELLEEISS